MKTKLATVLLIAFGAALVVAADETSAPPSYARDIEPIFVKACGDCHGADNPKKGLDLSVGRGYTDLLNRPSNEVGGLMLVAPGDAANSYLWHKLSHTAKEGKGMPRTLFASKKLPQAELDLVQRWIREGAKP